MSAFLSNLARNRWILPSLLALGFTVAVVSQYVPVFSGYAEIILMTIGINIILCASLNLVNGYMGEFSVGHAGFMSLGAYASAIFTMKLLPNIPVLFPVAVILGGVVAAVIGFLLALLSFKTRGDYLAIITLAFLMIVKSALENIPYVGGPSGLSVTNLTTLPWTFFWVVVTIFVIRNLIYSKFGRAIIAIREDEIAANAMGVRVREAKILAFVVSSFFGGVAGALFSHLNFINPKYFDIVKSTEILVMVYLGGVSSLGGSILGAVIFTFLFYALEYFNLGYWRMVILSAMLIALMLFRPRGIMGMRELPWLLPKRELSRKGELFTRGSPATAPPKT
ncbi:MAG: branched-chain amino acid ABC transporter permease [Chthoniobacterales bacterium]